MKEMKNIFYGLLCLSLASMDLHSSSSKRPILIIGAGPAGIAMAARLKKLGWDFDWVEKSTELAAGWKGQYDRLHLHTIKKYSDLPFLPFPKKYPHYVSRDEFISYLEDYCYRMDMIPHLGLEVSEIERENNHYLVLMGSLKKSYKNIILCTGLNRVPYMPQLAGEQDFRGEIVHSRTYKSGAKYKHKRVLVVGMGNTGAEIALDLYEQGAHPTLAVRRPINIIPRDFLGISIQESALMLEKLPAILTDFIGRAVQKIMIGDLSAWGLPPSPLPPAREITVSGHTPVIDIGTVDAIKKGYIKVINNLAQINADGVIDRLGHHYPFDAIIYATGYRCELSRILPFINPYLNKFGYPDHTEIAELPGLYFLGFVNTVLGAIYRIKTDSEIIANSLLSLKPK